jgi:hypothetical protein
MAIDLGTVSERLFEDVMAPLVLGGPLKPPHAIGARVALGLGAAERLPTDIDLASRVQMARVRRARRLAPVDRFGPPTAAEWALAAMLSDVLQAANPVFDTALRRRAASRILSVAVAGFERVPLPSHPKDALSRHTWFARALDVARTDTTVSWWVGSKTYFGVEPPARLQAWPSVRRVHVSSRPTPLVELGPLAFDSERLVNAVARFLERTPLTDLATCSRTTPAFAWTPGSLALVAARAGKTLALRALSRLSSLEADAALGRASRDLLRRFAGPLPPPGDGKAASLPAEAFAVASLHADRAIALAESGEMGTLSSWPDDVAFARCLGAVAARQSIAGGKGGWSDGQRRALLACLDPASQSAYGQQVLAALAAARVVKAAT